MEEEEFENYLRKRYGPEVSWYNNGAARNKRYYHWLQWDGKL